MICLNIIGFASFHRYTLVFLRHSTSIRCPSMVLGSVWWCCNRRETYADARGNIWQKENFLLSEQGCLFFSDLNESNMDQRKTVVCKTKLRLVISQQASREGKCGTDIVESGSEKVCTESERSGLIRSARIRVRPWVQLFSVHWQKGIETSQKKGFSGWLL